MAHRAEAQKVAGITEKQRAGLALSPRKGRRVGSKNSEESKRKVSESHKRFCAENPDKVAARGAKIRGENHYLWKGGVSRLNTSIRRMTENRSWMAAVKARDGRCVRCGSTDGLEAHHIRPLADLVADLGITCRDDAHALASPLWDIANGQTLCVKCHYAEHRRTGPPNSRKTMFKACLECGVTFAVRPSMFAKRKTCSIACRSAALRAGKQAGARNPNWRGGRVEKRCIRCDKPIFLKPVNARAGLGKWCSKECRYARE